ncbi:MAG: methionyl-tRNA formyltransferase [Actinomycetota bacterium]
MASIEIPERVRKVIYLGTPEVAVAPLREMHQAGIEVTLVITGEDKRRGRGKEKSPTPVKEEAQRLGIPVSHKLQDIYSSTADIGVVVAYGKLIPQEILSHLPMVNIHFSLLPQWRGAAPLERAILSGDKRTGVCIMQVEKELDAGGIFRMQEVLISEEESLQSLREKLSIQGNILLMDCLMNGFGTPRAQEGEPTYARKIHIDDLQVDWEESAEQVLRVIRLGNAWTTIKGNRLGIQEAKSATSSDLNAGEIKGTMVGTGQGAIELISVKPSGRKEMDANSWANGLRLNNQDCLGE